MGGRRNARSIAITDRGGNPARHTAGAALARLLGPLLFRPLQFGTRWLAPLVVAVTAGCLHGHAPGPIAPGLAGGAIPNPLPVVALDQDYLWNQVIDTVDDYFRIEREVRMRVDGGVVTDGLVQTFPTTGATYLEPWRDDSTHGYERRLATLQSIRRRATVRISPTSGGYDIELAVYKELEDVAQPEHATVGASTLRHDGSLVRNEPDAEAGPPTLGWIPQGRDYSLEQRMLAELRGRLGDPAATQRLPLVAP